MVGLIHQTLLNLVESAAGTAAVLEVKRRAGLSGEQEFRMDSVYDDGQWQRLLAATCQVLEVTPAQAEQAFADFFIQDAQQRWPTWFAMSRNAREFLERQPMIHNSFATAVRNPADRQAIIDKFNIEKQANELIVHYASPNQLCGLYLALARRIISHYGDNATVEETRCCKRGDPKCEVHIRWPECGDH